MFVLINIKFLLLKINYYIHVNYDIALFSRFCLLETSCEQSDNFPSSLLVKVNGKMCPLPVSVKAIDV